MTTHLGTPQRIPTDELTTFHNNPRKGNIPAIAESLRTNGQYRPIVVNKGTHTGRPLEVLAGNHTLMAARYLDGSPHEIRELDAYVVDVDDDHASRIVLADNRTADLGSYDDEELTRLLQSVDDLEGTGYLEEDLSALLDTNEDMTYTRDVNIPLYEPQGDTPPALESLFDATKTEELSARIEEAELPQEVADFLHLAAARHTVLDFQKIADYYAHATPEVQALMEDQALVIIDVDDAIRGGYAQLQEDLDAQKLAEGGEG